MEAIIAGCTDVINRQERLQETMADKLETYKRLLQDTKDNISKDPEMTQQYLKALQEKTNKLQFNHVQKDFQNALTKFGKEIERRFKQDVSVIYHPEAFAGKEHLIRRALVVHFIRQGQFDLCDTFVRETSLDKNEEFCKVIVHLKNEFQQMYTIIKELEAYKLDRAIIWAQAHREPLTKVDSCLEFNLHRLRFIQLLTQSTPLEAIAYGRKYFGAFGDRHFPEIKRLMTSTIYPNLPTSPYADLFPHMPLARSTDFANSPPIHITDTDPSVQYPRKSSTSQGNNPWADICHEFQRDFCSLLHMSADSLLYTSLLVGTTALPIFLKFHKIMSAKKTEWSLQDELPVEIPLEDDLRFHSVFACPVSREQATEDNPPMMMPCGHVICKDSLTRVSRNRSYGRSVMRFKCPYCPSESSVDQAKQVYF